jgi:hypothetical protein
MGDIDDFFSKKLKVTGDAQKAIQFAEGAIATVAGVMTIVGAASALLDLFFEQADAVSAKLDELIGEFRVVTATSESLALMREVAVQLEDARAQASTIRSALPGLPDPAETALVKNNSLKVVNTLGNRSFWMRPFFKQGVYSDGWIGDLTPPVDSLGGGAKAVFDWRLTLPAYLEAVVIRVFVLSALVDDYRSKHRDELLGIARRLRGFHTEISNGIKMHRPPDRADLVSHFLGAGPVTLVTPSNWDMPGRRFGAVEMYSARHSVDGYPSDVTIDLKPEEVPTLDNYQRFRVRHGLRTLFRWKQTYNHIGLPVVGQVINQLHGLVGDPFTIQNAGEWSVVEVDRLVAGELGVSNRLPDGRLSCRLLLSRIGGGSLRIQFER